MKTSKLIYKLPQKPIDQRPLWWKRLGLKRFVSKSQATQRIKGLAGPDGKLPVIKVCPTCREWMYIDVVEGEGRDSAKELPVVIAQLKKEFGYLRSISHDIFPGVSNRYCNLHGEEKYKELAEGIKGKALKPEFRKADRPTVISKILVVDDEIPLLKLFKRFIERFGFQVEVIDPEKLIKEQVLDMARNFDLILMDASMPEITGMRLTKLLREKGYRGYVVANSNDSGMREETIAAGADFEVIQKSPSLFRKFFEEQ